MQNFSNQSRLPKVAFHSLIFSSLMIFCCLLKQIILTAQRLEMCLMSFVISLGRHLVKLSREYIFLQMLTEILGSRYLISLDLHPPLSLGKYLGFPLKHTYRSTQAYNFILDRVKQKLSDWKASMLSLAGRTILIQASSAAIPSYVMQLSYFPGKILDGIDRVNQNFLWRVIGRRKFIGLDGKRLPNQRRKGALGCNQPREEILHSLRNKLEISFRRGSFVGSSVKKKILLWKKSACC